MLWLCKNVFFIGGLGSINLVPPCTNECVFYSLNKFMLGIPRFYSLLTFASLSRNFFLGLVGLILFVNRSARLALAVANGGLVESPLIGEVVSAGLKLIEGILPPNP